MEFDVRLTIEFSDWLDGLADDIAVAAIAERLLRVRRGLFGDHASVGDRVSEPRIHHGPGYRVYYTLRDRVVVFMLARGRKRTRQRDIDRATTLETRALRRAP